MSEKYRGFTITCDCPPIPVRSLDWSAVSDDFDASYEGPEDGWKTSGQSFTGETREEVIKQIDDWYLENGTDEDTHTQTGQ